MRQQNSVDGGVTGNVTGKWSLFYLQGLLHWDEAGARPEISLVFQHYYFVATEKRGKYICVVVIKQDVVYVKR